MTIATIVFIGWCGVLGLVFGCPQDRGPGLVETNRQMHALEQQTRQQEIDARYMTEQQRIEQQRQADQLYAQTEQERIRAHATSEALAERESTYRTEVLNAGMTERLYKAEIERTNRLRMFIRFLMFLTVIGTALFVLKTAADWLPRRDPPLELPPLPEQPQVMAWPDFWRAAETLNYDIVEDEQGRVIGVLFMNNAPNMFLLPGEVDA